MLKLFIFSVMLLLIFACGSPQDKLNKAIENSDIEYIVHELTHNATQIEIQTYKRAIQAIDGSKIGEDSLSELSNFLREGKENERNYRIALAQSLDSSAMLTGCKYEEKYSSSVAYQTRYLIENNIFTFLACTKRDGRDVSLGFDWLNMTDEEKIAWVRAQKFYSSTSKLLDELHKIDLYLEEAKEIKESIVDKHVVIIRPVIGEERTYTAYINGNDGAVILQDETKANQKVFGLKLTFVGNGIYKTQSGQSISLPTWKEVSPKLLVKIQNYGENIKRKFEIEPELLSLTSSFFNAYNDIRYSENITLSKLESYCKSTVESAFISKVIKSKLHNLRIEELNDECKKAYLTGLLEQDLIKYKYHYSLDRVSFKNNKKLESYKNLITMCVKGDEDGVYDNVKIMLNDRHYSDFKYFDSTQYLEQLKKACPATMEKGLSHTIGSSLISESDNHEFNNKLLINVCSSGGSEQEYLDILADIKAINNNYKPSVKVTDACWKNQIIGDYFEGVSNDIVRSAKLKRDIDGIFPFYPRLFEATLACHKVLNGKGHKSDLIIVNKMLDDLDDRLNKFELRTLSRAGEKIDLFERYCGNFKDNKAL